MKNKAIAIISVFMLSFHTVVNSANCLPGYAMEMAYAAVEYATDIAYCETAMFTGPCRQEAELAYNKSMNDAYANFNTCCCSNDLPCCN